MSFSDSAEEKNTCFVTVLGKTPDKLQAESVTVVVGRIGKGCTAIQALKSNQGSIPQNVLLIDTFEDIDIDNGKVPVRMANLGPEMFGCVQR